MIVKDEENNIRRALDSIKNVVDEIVVVDTGSSDNTPNIVREYTDKLYFHPWKNDFSEARNNSLKYPTCEWVFIFDADEEVSKDFINGIREFLKSLPKDVNTVYLPTISYLDWDFKRTEIASTPRIFRNGTVHYENIVHNQAVCKPKIVNANFLIYHYGYIWTRKLKKQKYERTANLIRKHLQHCRNDQERLYYLVQLYKTEKTGGKPHQAAQIGWESLNLMKKLSSIPAIGLEFLYIFSIDLMNAGLDDLAIQVAQSAIDAVPEYPDPYLAMINIYLRRKDWAKIVEYYEKFRDVVENALKKTEKFSWTIMSFKDIPTAEIAGMIGYIELERYERFNELAQERFSKDDDILVNLIQNLINKIAEKNVERCLPALKYLTSFVRRKEIKVNMQPVYEKIVEKGVAVELSNIVVKDVTPLSFALLKRMETKQDLLLTFLSSENVKNVVKENGVGGLLFLYSLLEESQKKGFLEKFTEDEDSTVRGVAKAILADHLLKESKFLDAIRSYRDAIQLVPELSQFIKPIVEDLKTRLDPTIDGVYEELYHFYSKQKEFLIDFKKYLGNDVNKLYLLSDNDMALYVSAVHMQDEKKAIELLERIREPHKFPMYYYRLAKFYSKIDKKKSLSYHIKALEENEKLADIVAGTFGYTGLYPNIILNWFDDNDEILWVGNISEKFTTFGVIHPVRAWFRAKNGLMYAKPYPANESIKAYGDFEKQYYQNIPFTVKPDELYKVLLNLDWHDLRADAHLENFHDVFSELGIHLTERSENVLLIQGVEQTPELKTLLSDAGQIVMFYHVPNISKQDDIVWYYPGFRILRTTKKVKEELAEIGFKTVHVEPFMNGLRAIFAKRER